MDAALQPLNQAVWDVLRTLWPVWMFFAALIVGKIAWYIYQQRRLARSGIADIDTMNGTTFERYLETLFRKYGYHVSRTPVTGDFGADLVISKGGKRTVVQAKRYAKSVGVKAVQEAVAAQKMYGCTAAMVVTNSTYTSQAQKLARANSVELWNRQRLVSAILAAQKKPALSGMEEQARR